MRKEKNNPVAKQGKHRTIGMVELVARLKKRGSMGRIVNGRE
jgi:hypothetical protein